MDESLRQQAMSSYLSEAQGKAYKSEDSGKGGVFKFLATYIHPKPYARYTITYDDNIYKVADAESDIIHAYGAGINFIVDIFKEPEKPENIFYSEYESKWEKLFDINSGLNFDLGFDETFYQKKKLRTGTGFKFGGGSNSLLGLNLDIGIGKKTAKHSWQVREKIQRGYTYASTLTNGSSGQSQGEIIEKTTSATDLMFGGTYNRLGYEIGFNRTLTEYTGAYKNSNTTVANELRFSGYFTPLPMPKTHFFGEYTRGWQEYPDAGTTTNNSTNNSVAVGVRGRLSPKIEGVGKVGYEWVDYENGDRSTGNTYEADLTFKASELTSMSLVLSHGIQDASNREYSYDHQTSGVLGYKHTFAGNPKLSLDAYGSMVMEKFKSAGENYINEVGCGLSYAFRKWLILKLTYSFTKKTSHTLDDSYRNNIVAASINASF
jgi:hypothetical protein